MDPLVTFFEPEAAKMLRISLATIKRMRKAGIGPSYLKIGTRIRYRRDDLIDWLDSKHVPGAHAVTRQKTPIETPKGTK